MAYGVVAWSLQLTTFLAVCMVVTESTALWVHAAAWIHVCYAYVRAAIHGALSLVDPCQRLNVDSRLTTSSRRARTLTCNESRTPEWLLNSCTFAYSTTWHTASVYREDDSGATKASSVSCPHVAASESRE